MYSYQIVGNLPELKCIEVKWRLLAVMDSPYRELFSAAIRILKPKHTIYSIVATTYLTSFSQN